MTGKKFRVLLAERAPGEAADSLRALYPGPDSRLELSIVSTLPTLVATIELDAPETIFFDLSLGKPDLLEAVRRVRRAALGIPLIVFADVADKSYASRSISEGDRLSPKRVHGHTHHGTRSAYRTRAYLPAATGHPSEGSAERRLVPSVVDVRGTETLLAWRRLRSSQNGLKSSRCCSRAATRRNQEGWRQPRAIFKNLIVLRRSAAWSARSWTR
jgi:hypothetical protein